SPRRAPPARRDASTPAGTPRRTQSSRHLRFDRGQDRVDLAPDIAPRAHSLGEGAPAARRGAVVLARRAAVAGRAMRRDEAVALEPAEQRIDRALSDGGETPLAQPPRHLVAVGGLVDDDREQAEVED